MRSIYLCTCNIREQSVDGENLTGEDVTVESDFVRCADLGCLFRLFRGELQIKRNYQMCCENLTNFGFYLYRIGKLQATVGGTSGTNHA